MFAGCLQIMWAHSHLIRAAGVGYSQIIRAENADVCRPYGLCLQAATAMDHDGEERLGNELLALVDNNKPLPTLKTLQERYLGSKPVPVIPARQQDLASYDHLLQGNWHLTEAVGHA
jgi:hypothetical protein